MAVRETLEVSLQLSTFALEAMGRDQAALDAVISGERCISCGTLTPAVDGSMVCIVASYDGTSSGAKFFHKRTIFLSSLRMSAANTPRTKPTPSSISG